MKYPKHVVSIITLMTALLSQTALAHNKVVVIPMAGDDVIVPGVSHPVADPITNSIGMQFNILSAGNFTMGSPVGEPGRTSSGTREEIPHTVTLTNAFGMQVTKVTNAQWNAVIVNTFFGVNPSVRNTQDNYPVESVLWFDAIFFANRLSIEEGKSLCYTTGTITGTPGSGSLAMSNVTPIANCTGYRLPTEAEWEYAARAGTIKAYANPIGFDDSDTETGNGFNSNLNAMGWYSYNREMVNGNAVPAYEDGTKPVAKKQANAWGLYDMHGNVFEWTGDWFAAYSGSAETDPSGPVTGSSLVARGGSWFSGARDSRSAFRINASTLSFFPDLGFRLVLPQVQ